MSMFGVSKLTTSSMRVSFCMCTCCVSCMYVKIVSKVSEKVEYKRCLCVYYATPKATERPANVETLPLYIAKF